jgi:hypothetical protein
MNDESVLANSDFVQRAVPRLPGRVLLDAGYSSKLWALTPFRKQP